ncbi:MAG: UDP-N-acetylmuramoyl-L-alanyl-D-glutamate--2,6-diaminopimelate ligase [Candidatus Cryptobacteroides sp.]|nr:UDP-N-acetylmuramoyl-L-alanyl-D-glutamate--2,6-diaminopimelate ligase [Candidatus Cryptobacteroides sp.]
MKKLSEILSAECLVQEIAPGTDDAVVAGICFDSRKVAPGSLFVAIPGTAYDGHEFIGKAVKDGACAIVYENEEMAAASLRREGLDRKGVVMVRVKSSRKALAHLSANFYDNPSRKLKLVAITGTNGKTTTVTLLYRLFTALGYNCGMLSTIANYVGSRRSETANTTSDPLTINSLLAQMVDSGCGYCFMEASSIGIEQDRIAGLEISVAIFSNLTHDHLDYHKSFAEYLRCKKMLFDSLPKEATAIVNIDDRNGEVMIQNCRARKMTYSLRGTADHNCRILEESFAGMMLRIDGTECWTPLVGRHNAYNLLAAYCTALALGAGSEETLVALSSLQAAPGRLETLRASSGLTVMIDYAHTPDALENVLTTLKDVNCSGGKIICLFGCGGDRDRTKRPEMAAVAQKYADRIFVTSDNSRSERTEDIMEEIKKGFDISGLRKTLFIADRKEAIRTAILTADAQDVVLLAGKGHETYQINANGKEHFDEREIVNEVFSQLM